MMIKRELYQARGGPSVTASRLSPAVLHIRSSST